MERKITKYLEDWKNSTDIVPLIIDGARNVGKTYIVLHFGKNSYKNVIRFDMEKHIDLDYEFEIESNCDIVINKMQSISNQEIISDNTLIIFDEMHSFRKCLVIAEFFNSNFPSQHIVICGSMFASEYKSFPIVRRFAKFRMKTLFPMNFEEFVIAMDKKDYLDFANMNLEEDSTLGMNLHQDSIVSTNLDILELFYKYLLVGGMPTAVEAYKSLMDLDYVLAKQKNISNTILSDIMKYLPFYEHKKAISVLNCIHLQLFKENKKFQFSYIKNKATSYEYDAVIDWLVYARVLYKVYKLYTNATKEINLKSLSNFRLYYNDVGILYEKFGISEDAVLKSMHNMEKYLAILMETHIINIFIAKGYKVFYWNDGAIYNIDIVIIDTNNNYIPVECDIITSTTKKSIKKFIETHNSPYSIRIITKETLTETNVKTIPIYMLHQF